MLLKFRIKSTKIVERDNLHLIYFEKFVSSIWFQFSRPLRQQFKKYKTNYIEIRHQKFHGIPYPQVEGLNLKK